LRFKKFMPVIFSEPRQFGLIKIIEKHLSTPESHHPKVKEHAGQAAFGNHRSGISLALQNRGSCLEVIQEISPLAPDYWSQTVLL